MVVNLTTVRAQELVTDRPDQTESSRVVPIGLIQIESGWVLTENEEASIQRQTHQLPSSLLRIGILDNVELRLGMDGFYWENKGGLRKRGFGNIEVGTKILVGCEKAWQPETALLASLSMPTDEKALDPSFRALFSHTLSDRLASGYNIGVSWSTEGDGNTLTDFNYTAALGIGLISGISMFVEFFGDIPIGSSRSAAHSFDGGFTVLIRENIQLDLSGAIGLSEGAEDRFIGLGASLRLPR